MKITKTNLKNWLKEKYADEWERKKTIEAWLIKHLLRYSSDDRCSHLKDIAYYGCSSGCVGGLIYTYDIIRFYQKYEARIWSIVSDYLESTGETLGQFWDSMRVEITEEHIFKTYMTWFVIENLASEILNHFEIEY